VKPREWDPQLAPVRAEMLSRFAALSDAIASLRVPQASRGAGSRTSNVLVSSVQRLLKENAEKDRQIAAKRAEIAQLNARHTDTRVRDVLRQQLSELGTKLTAQRHLTREKMDEHQRLNAQIEEVQAQIAQTKTDAEKRLTALRERFEVEKQKQADELEQARKQLEWNVKHSEDEVAKIKAQFQRAQSENKSLKTQTTRDVAAELKKMQDAVPGIVQRPVKQMVAGVYEMIQENFDEDQDYDGQAVMKAIRTALRAQTNEMLEELDQQGEEEEA
jgi:chromosome segregation ATPase